MGSNSNGTTSGRLVGKRILITGAGGGIGSDAMRYLKEEGATVLGIDLNAGEDILKADIRDVEEVKKAVDEVIKRLGGIDILINNAGIGRGQDSGDFPDEQARLIMEVNFFGTWNMTAAAMPLF
ncbi:SDR family NAD(P)-dependent oxidoreductase [Cytobacillus suaedae]|nr:SDR family NAD(P)-dependent oxidoreductase [Cytobacillus suaedae]